MAISMQAFRKGTEMENEKKTYNYTKTIDVLEALASSQSYIGVREINRKTGLSVSSIYRILSELQERGYVLKNPENKKYRIGSKALSLTENLMNRPGNMMYLVHVYMSELNLNTKETIHLACLNGAFSGMYLSKIDTPHAIGLLSKVGRKFPLYCTGAGKALLAYSPEPFVKNYLEKAEMEKFTPKTLYTPEMLEKDLIEIRRKGFAVDDEEHHLNTVCVAAPIFDSGGNVIASMSIAAPKYRMPLEHLTQFAGILVERTQALSQSGLTAEMMNGLLRNKEIE